MFPELMSEYGSKLIVAVLGVGLALLCLVGILWIVRGRRGPSPFVRGGRNRQPRLQVLDAAAVDARRRLVLVRRDDVEHLIMIGGPTDVVIESRISSLARSAEIPVHEPHSAQPAAIPAPAAPTMAKLPAAEPQKRPMQASEPRTESIREITTTEVSAREIRPTAAPQPAVIAANSIPNPRIEPAANPAAPARLDHAQPPSRAMPPVAGQPAIEDAARLLDSQRDRVFAERSTPAPAPAMRPVSQPMPVSADKASGLGSDFEKILEEEMANNMAARDASLANRTIRTPLPQAGPAVIAPTVNTSTGAMREDPSLQSEVARIFGEMSASREK